jgi:hypothetical protein
VPEGKKGQFTASLLFDPGFKIAARKVSFVVK